MGNYDLIIIVNDLIANLQFLDNFLDMHYKHNHRAKATIESNYAYNVQELVWDSLLQHKL